MSSWVCSQSSYGGMFQVGVLVEQCGEGVHVVLLEGGDVALEQSLLVGVQSRPGLRRSHPCSASVARARWSALLTDATVVSSSSATSSAFQCRTSRRIRTARWRGGRCWSAATNARRIDSRAIGDVGRVAARSARARSSGDRLDPAVLGQRGSRAASRPSVPARGPSAVPVAVARRACSGTRSWRSGRATSGSRPGPRTWRSRSRPERRSPGRRPPPRTRSPASGSSSP